MTTRMGVVMVLHTLHHDLEFPRQQGACRAVPGVVQVLCESRPDLYDVKLPHDWLESPLTKIMHFSLCFNAQTFFQNLMNTVISDANGI